MIIKPSASRGNRNKQAWQTDLANMITDVEELMEIVGLTGQQMEIEALAGKTTITTKNTASSSLRAFFPIPTSFPLRVTRSFASRIAKGNPKDPLLLQVLPKPEESFDYKGFSTNPLNESFFQQDYGVLQKYHGRALLITTGACAIHCRYCFRRHFPYQQHQQNRRQWQNSLKKLSQDQSLEEIILSGGDPLILPDHQLAALIQEIGDIPQISTLRIHTRMPVVLPNRITPGLISLLDRTNLNIVIVIHSNHPNEISPEVGSSLTKLRKVSNAVLNQIVLLKDINDTSDTIASLNRKLFAYGILPYYLHMLDKVSGAGHFEADSSVIKRMMIELRQELPGYLVPKVVCETPGALSKTPVMA